MRQGLLYKDKTDALLKVPFFKKKKKKIFFLIQIKLKVNF